MAKPKLKQLRTEVIKKINELMKGGDVIQFEMKFDHQEGMSYKSFVDSKSAKYKSERFFFDEKGEVVDESHVAVCDARNEYPLLIYDIYDSASLVLGNYSEVEDDDLET